jgi:8-oxo-dGTP pyrophosphatase MutT (NUDIX family)
MAHCCSGRFLESLQYSQIVSPQESMDCLPPLARKISALLGSHTPRKLNPANKGRAAVLMPIFEHDRDLYFLLTLRTDKVETHKNQISFPGGVRDPKDSELVQTALRESWEEVGLAAESVTILGEFDEYYSITDLIVTPFVGWLDSLSRLTPSPDEVQEILRVPWSIFRNDDLLRIEMRRRFEREMKIYFYQFGEKEVWGLTAQIIRDFLQLIEPLEHSGSD